MKIRNLTHIIFKNFINQSNECTVVTGPSTAVVDEPDNDSLSLYVSKVLLKTGLAYTEQLLHKNSHIASESSIVITEKYSQIGEEIYNNRN